MKLQAIEWYQRPSRDRTFCGRVGPEERPDDETRGVTYPTCLRLLQRSAEGRKP